MIEGPYCKTIVDSHREQWRGYNFCKEDISEGE